MHLARILIVEHHETLRDGLVALIGSCRDMEIVRTASSVHQALDAIKEADPDVTIIDLDIPLGLALLQRIRRERPEIRTISLVSYEWEYPAAAACCAGGTSFLPKDRIGNLLLPLIRSA